MGTAFGTMPSGSAVADQLAPSAAAHLAFRNLAHGGPLAKKSRPGVLKVDIQPIRQSSVVVRLQRLVRLEEGMLTLFFSAAF